MTDFARNSIALVISLVAAALAVLGVRYFLIKQPTITPPVVAPTPSPFPSADFSPFFSPTSTPTSTSALFPSPKEELANVVVVEADDFGFYPSNTIIAKAGAPLTLVFKVRTENVYYAGLQIKSPLFDTGPIKPGGIVSVDFVPPKGKTIFTSYWPYQKIKKVEGEIIGE